MQNVIDITCYASDGETKVDHVTQWDKGQTICFSNSYDLTDPPTVHWCNRMSEEALQVKTAIDNGKIYADIPNTLLQEPYPLIGYVYLYKSEDISETILQIRIPLKSRPKPSDYYYIENVDRISLTTINNKLDNVCYNLTEIEKVLKVIQEKLIEGTISDEATSKEINDMITQYFDNKKIVNTELK